MIVHPGARTRAFYMWELNDLKRRRGVHQIFSRLHARWIAHRFITWAREGISINGHPLMCFPLNGPRIEIRNIKGDPYYDGRSLIVLTRQDHLNVTLIHELVHALGYGSSRNPHNRAFVLKYIDALAWWFGWDADELRLQAHQWGLI